MPPRFLMTAPSPSACSSFSAALDGTDHFPEARADCWTLLAELGARDLIPPAQLSRERVSDVVPTLQARKLRLRKVRLLWRQSTRVSVSALGLNPDGLTPEPMILTIYCADFSLYPNEPLWARARPCFFLFLTHA